MGSRNFSKKYGFLLALSECLWFSFTGPVHQNFTVTNLTTTIYPIAFVDISNGSQGLLKYLLKKWQVTMMVCVRIWKPLVISGTLLLGITRSGQDS